ncbi:MAG TPA: tripartite tricarboxylate transporter substrate-binding protein [candidate division Zixibacteria bacterium]|nr:tripartite tricarboxylate transporter substrate-binding protein [candidate division Zixibacteria bacterium]
MKVHLRRLLAAAGCCAALAAVPAPAQEAFYRGKSIRLIVAFSPGGGFDTYSRAIGRHLGKHIPGRPSVVVENMTGAGGIIQANFMYQSARPDGLTIGNNIGGLILQQIMGAKGIEFDGRRFEYLGAPAVDHPVCALSRTSGVTTVDAWFAAREPVKLGGVGPGGTASDVARTLKAALKLPIQVVDGYKGTSDIRLAAESGELAGGCWAWESIKSTWRKGLDSKEVAVVIQAMPKKHPELPHVPLAIDYAKTQDAKDLLKYAVHDIATVTRPYFLPPGTPRERVETLRRAFLETYKDPEFLAEARKAKLEVDPVTGDEMERIVKGLFNLDSRQVARLKEVLVPK